MHPYDRSHEVLPVHVHIAHTVFFAKGRPSILYVARITPMPYNPECVNLLKAHLAFHLCHKGGRGIRNMGKIQRVISSSHIYWSLPSLFAKSKRVAAIL